VLRVSFDVKEEVMLLALFHISGISNAFGLHGSAFGGGVHGMLLLKNLSFSLAKIFL